MPEFLTAAWVADRVDPAVPGLIEAGAALRVQYVVTGGPEGEVRYGTVVDGAGGSELLVGEVSDPDVTLTLTAKEARAVLTGELDPNVGFMRGTTKVAGHTGRLLDLLAASRGEAYEALRRELAERTS